MFTDRRRPERLLQVYRQPEGPPGVRRFQHREPDQDAEAWRARGRSHSGTPPGPDEPQDGRPQPGEERHHGRGGRDAEHGVHRQHQRHPRRSAGEPQHAALLGHHAERDRQHHEEVHEESEGDRDRQQERRKQEHPRYLVQARDKYLALKRIADFYPNIYGIVFCRTRKETQEIADKLIQDGYNADSLHGELSQAQRDYVMQKFRVKNIQLLVATDVAARGLDVDDLTHVINYGLPDEVESYTHRRGRTGRAGKTGISISICHVKEKGKIREIERIINKKFEKGEMPTGHAICEKQLFNLVDQIEKVKVNEEEIASLMPQIYRKLEWLDKEDIIKRVVSLEFNRMIDYYKDADEIQQVDERSSRSERGERRAHAAEEGYSRFFLNFGKADGLYPNQLIELVNKCVPGKVRIGKIDLRENFSFFEVEEGEAQRVMDSMNGFEVDGRRISVEPAQGKKEEGGRGGKRSYGGRRSDDGYKGKRGSKDSGRRGGDRSDRTFRKDERDSDRPWKRTAAARDARKKRRF